MDIENNSAIDIKKNSSVQQNPNYNELPNGVEDSHQPRINLQSYIKNWAVKHNITLSALTDLLIVLKPQHPELPKDSRSLLRVSSKYEIITVDPGQYCHLGLERGINYIFKKTTIFCKTGK